MGALEEIGCDLVEQGVQRGVDDAAFDAVGKGFEHLVVEEQDVVVQCPPSLVEVVGMHGVDPDVFFEPGGVVDLVRCIGLQAFSV